MQRNRFEHARAGHFKRGEQRAHGFAEAFDLVRPDIGCHEFSQRVARRQAAANVPEFLQVEHLGVLGLFGAERGVTARAAAAFDLVGALDRVGQRKERLGHGLGLIDQILRDAVIAHHGKTIFAKTAPQLIGDGIEWLGERD